MSDNQDIRAWARENGWPDLGDRGRIPGDAREAYEGKDFLAQPRSNGQADDDIFVITPDPAPASAAPAAPEARQAAKATDGGERPPAPVAQKRRGMFQRQPSPGPKPKGKAKPRVSIENILSSGWGLGAMALARSPNAIPVSRVLQVQAPVAGIIGDELLRGTVIDRLLQPLARSGAKAEMAVALVGPPLLVGVMTARPETFPVLRPALKMTMMTWLEIAEPAMAKVQKREQDWAEKFGEIDLDGMIDALWAGLPEPGPVSEQEEEHVRRARGDDG